jgi:hypothetical protein
MKKVFLISFLLISSVGLNAQRFEVDTISMTGDLSDRINMVFLGDGYRESEMEKFSADVKWMINALFSKPPYSNYKSYFNCFAIKVPSEVSGAAEDPSTLINNYFGSTFNYAGIWRLVVPTRTTRITNVLATNFPRYDQVFMIVNDSRYGGSGGWVATSTTHTDGPEICIHELGHSFAGLSDEYWAGQQYARENINMTQVTDTKTVKWSRWINFSQTGIYPHTEAPAWYRPHQNCEMRYLNRQFCPICKEATVSRILDLVDPVIEYAPSATTFEFTTDTVFSISLLKPAPNTVKTDWILNGDTLAHNTDSLFLRRTRLIAGKNQLSCYILDTTALIRDLLHPRTHLSKVTWIMENTSSVIGRQISDGRFAISAYPNPASDLIHLSISSNGGVYSDWIIRLIDPTGREIGKPARISGASGSLNHTMRIPGLKTPDGQYFISVQSKDFRYRIPILIVR